MSDKPFHLGWFSQFELDQPLPPVTTNGERGSREKLVQGTGGGTNETLRQLAMDRVARCLTRTPYTGEHFRHNLVEF